MTRTDIHSPTNLVTEDYDYVGYFDAHPEDGETVWIDHSAAELEEADTPWTYTGHCGHCGQSIRYGAFLRHNPTNRILRVGERCLGNRFDRSSQDFHRMRKNASESRKQQRIKRAREAWFAVDADREIAFTFATEQVQAGNHGYQGMRHSFVHKINRYGSTSDKFVKAMMRDMVRTERRAEEQAARDAEKAEQPPVPEGRYEIVGQIIKTAWQDNDFGGRLVMTVKDDRGFLVWGSVPASLDDDLHDLLVELDAEDFVHMVKSHEIRVSFTAAVERGDRDHTFGFYKRPSKAQILATAPKAVAA